MTLTQAPWACARQSWKQLRGPRPPSRYAVERTQGRPWETPRTRMNWQRHPWPFPHTPPCRGLPGPRSFWLHLAALCGGGASAKPCDPSRSPELAQTALPPQRHETVCGPSPVHVSSQHKPSGSLRGSHRLLCLPPTGPMVGGLEPQIPSSGHAHLPFMCNLQLLAFDPVRSYQGKGRAKSPLAP